MNEYTALAGILAPGTYAFGYQRGDAVAADVVEGWGLVVGEQVVEGDLDEDTAAPVTAALRPGPESNRAAWESWAVANGWTAEDAAAGSQGDLEAIEAAPPAAPVPADKATGTDFQNATPVTADNTPGPAEAAADVARPAESAKKSDWVLYVNDHPQATSEDQAWAGDDTTTKADLIAWEPGGNA